MAGSRQTYGDSNYNRPFRAQIALGGYDPRLPVLLLLLLLLLVVVVNSTALPAATLPRADGRRKWLRHLDRV